MKVRPHGSLLVALTAMLCLFMAAHARQNASSSSWASARSEHFLVVGDAGAENLRAAAARLEQYRAAFARLKLGSHHTDSTTPTTVFLFRDDNSYSPFKPVYRGETDDAVAGYFQAGSEVDYITLSLADERTAGESSTLLHEYVHLLVKNTYRGAPLWFKEGLAEYYSTAAMSDGNRRVTLGKPLKNRLQFIRRRALMPLPALFAVDVYSPDYHGREKSGVFYAQSWALVHYLLNGGGAERRAQLSHYLELLSGGAPAEESFRQAFKTAFVGFELELAAYIQFAKLPERVEEFDTPAEFNAHSEARALSEAETLAHLGDLLLHTDRADEAESYLQRAVALDAKLAPAQVSLGILRVRQNRFEEALRHLRQAVAADAQNHLAHYYLAEALYREGPETDGTVKGFEERTEALRGELNKVIELAPRFAEAYRLLALVEIERGGRLDEAATLLKKALALVPESYRFALLLAQVHLRREEFADARRVAEALARKSYDSLSRAQAQALVETVAAREEERAARLKSEQAATLAQAVAWAAALPCDMPDPGPQHKRMRFAGEQVCGQLVRIECDEQSVTLLVESRERTFRLRSDALKNIRFITYTSAVKTGQLTCGLREPSNPVLVTYRPRKDSAAAQSDGEAVAVEFVPADWNR